MHEQYPRPQLVRPQWQDLCGQWRFAFDDADVGRGAGWATSPEPFDQTITVPYPYESALSGIGDPSPRPVVWYRREVELAPPGPGERLLLHFGAVDHRAQVWVNGVHVGGHEGGHTPFSFDVTDALVNAPTQLIVTPTPGSTWPSRRRATTCTTAGCCGLRSADPDRR